MMGFESFQEFKEDLLFGFLSVKNIWVSLCAVDTLDVIDIDISITILVELSIGLSN